MSLAVSFSIFAWKILLYPIFLYIWLFQLRELLARCSHDLFVLDFFCLLQFTFLVSILLILISLYILFVHLNFSSDPIFCTFYLTFSFYQIFSWLLIHFWKKISVNVICCTRERERTGDTSVLGIAARYIDVTLVAQLLGVESRNTCMRSEPFV